jgi:hypothetical protein
VPETLVGGGKRYPTPSPQQFIPLEEAIASGAFGDDPHGRPPLTVGPSERGRQAAIEREAKRKQLKEEKRKKREERWKRIEEERKKKAEERRKAKPEEKEHHDHGEAGTDDHYSDSDYSDDVDDDIDDYSDDEWEDEMEEVYV